MNDRAARFGRSDDFARKAGAYVHIPFCAAVCPYCDFAVVAGKDDLIDRYCSAVIAEIEAGSSWRPLDAVYFGGGTPSRAPADLLGNILDALRRVHGFASDTEITLEANPEDFSLAAAESFRLVGFNRVSFGAQSFDARVLLALGRRHGPEHIVDAVGNARAAGFTNLSVDLIYGTPEETSESWYETVVAAMSAGPDHVSCYALTVEPGTELGKQVRAGAAAPDPDVQVDRFLVADETISRAGLARYEVSNWSRPDMECVYNSIVWAQGEYLAFGNGGHSFRDGLRKRNVRRLDAYLTAVEAGSDAVAGQDAISGWDAEIDRLFVGLRRTSGVALGSGGPAFLASAAGKRLVAAGVVEKDADRLLVINPMLTDEVLRVVLAMDEPTDQHDNADNVGVEVADA